MKVLPSIETHRRIMASLPQSSASDKTAAGWGGIGKAIGGFLGKAKGVGGAIANKAAPLARTAVTGNEMEGALLGTQMFTGYVPGMAGQLGLGFGFDLARPHLAKGLAKLDTKFVNRFGANAEAMQWRNNAKAGLNKFTQVSKLAPAAQVLGGVQEATMGFNQFDPHASMEMGRQSTIDNVAKSLGWNNGQEMGAEIQQFRPLIQGAKGVGRLLTSVGNKALTSAGRSPMTAIPDQHIETFVDKAINAYGDGFLSKSPQDQAAIVNTLYQTALRHGEL